MRTGFPTWKARLRAFLASTLVFASIEEQQDRDVPSCEGHVTKSANDSNSVVPHVLSFHVGCFG